MVVVGDDCVDYFVGWVGVVGIVDDDLEVVLGELVGDFCVDVV